jgi:hypothetical protein
MATEMKNSLSTRVWFMMVSVLLWTGIYFTGFAEASWLMYLAAVAMTLAAIIGYCPMQKLLHRLPGNNTGNA